MSKPATFSEPPENPVGPVIRREAFAVAAATLLHPFGWLAAFCRRGRGSATPRVAAQRTVVLVHGYLANASCFAPLSSYLRLNGKTQILAFEYRLNDSVEGAAIKLKAFLKKNVRGGRIDLVCHSLGGLVAVVYLGELGGARRVDRCVTLGTPDRGTYNAYWLLGRTARDLRPGSRLLTRLRTARDTARSKGVRMTSIVGASDNIVLPRVDVGTKRRRETVVVEGIGHTGLLFSMQVFREVAARLA